MKTARMIMAKSKIAAAVPKTIITTRVDWPCSCDVASMSVLGVGSLLGSTLGVYCSLRTKDEDGWLTSVLFLSGCGGLESGRMGLCLMPPSGLSGRRYGLGRLGLADTAGLASAPGRPPFPAFGLVGLDGLPDCCNLVNPLFSLWAESVHFQNRNCNSVVEVYDILFCC